MSASLTAQGHSLQAGQESVSDLCDFMEHLEWGGLGTDAIEAHYRALEGFFGWAVKDEWLSLSPTARL